MSDLDERLKRVVARTFDLRMEHVDDSTSSETVSAWDSVGQAELVLALEQEFGLAFSPEDILLMGRLEAIRALLQERGAGTGRD